MTRYSGPPRCRVEGEEGAWSGLVWNFTPWVPCYPLRNTSGIFERTYISHGFPPVFLGPSTGNERKERMLSCFPFWEPKGCLLWNARRGNWEFGVRTARNSKRNGRLRIFCMSKKFSCLRLSHASSALNHERCFEMRAPSGHKSVHGSEDDRPPPCLHYFVFYHSIQKADLRESKVAIVHANRNAFLAPRKGEWPFLSRGFPTKNPKS